MCVYICIQFDKVLVQIYEEKYKIQFLFVKEKKEFSCLRSQKFDIPHTRLAHLKCTRRLTRIETSRTVRSGFTRCLHYLAATVEHVCHRAWSLPFPVTLENVSAQRARSVLGSMARDAAPFAGRKCRVYKVSSAEASNSTTILVVVLPRAISLARLAFIRGRIVSLLFLIYLIHHLPLDRHVSSFFNPSSFRRFLSLVRILFPHLRATSFPLIYTRAFGPRAVSIETPRREKGGGWSRIGTPMVRRTKDTISRTWQSEMATQRVYQVRRQRNEGKRENSRFKFYRADNTVTVMPIRLWFIACPRDEERSEKYGRRKGSWGEREKFAPFHICAATRDPRTLSPFPYRFRCRYSLVIISSVCTDAIGASIFAHSRTYTRVHLFTIYICTLHVRFRYLKLVKL